MNVSTTWVQGLSITSGVFVTAPAGSGRQMLDRAEPNEQTVLYVDCAIGNPDDLLLAAICELGNASRIEPATNVREGLITFSEHLDALIVVVFDNVDLVEGWRPWALKSARDHLNCSSGAGLRLFFFGANRKNLSSMIYRKIEPFFCATLLENCQLPELVAQVGHSLIGR